MSEDIAENKASKKPHIIFFIVDDIGWSDFGYNNEDSPIPTPNIDRLAKQGIQLKSHYMHSLCTPSRAALMTGRYHFNTGLNYVIAPSNPAGLPDDIPTLPQVLKAEAGYHTAMAGKWHLGSAQRKLTPTGKGFDEFTGMYMWDLDSYTKQMYGAPWPPPLMIDWVREHRNGTFYHYAEPMHATDAITEAAIEHIRTHAAHHDEGLFLYVAFTAAHSPLQPQSRHTHVCRHIVNSWRRDFCGMVVGADEAVATIINAARKALGDELLVVLTSDNGGSTWFGGMNAPLRGSKATPLEGGTRVPAILLDYTPEQKYIGYRGSDWEKEGQRIYNGLFHVSDWMPTLLSLAGVSNDRWPAHMDGLDFSAIFHDVPYTPLTSPSLYLNVTYGYTFSARSEVLYELYLQEEFLFREALSAYRIGSYKLIDGPVRDPHYYFESSAGQVNSSDPSPFAKGLTELGIRLGDAVFGLAPFDQLRTFLTFGNLHSVYTARQRTRQDTLRLFDLATDPLETTNLASLPQYTHIVAQLRSRIEKIKANRPTPIQKAYLQLPLDEVWSKMHVPGNCSMNPAIQPRDCRFIHPWIPDDADPWSDPRLLSATDYLEGRLIELAKQIALFVVLPLAVLLGMYAFSRRGRTSRRVDYVKETKTD